ncbi:hypothetical protein DL766_005294 [Monosporascus sp. MC13-8B]|uniref:U1-type domain-containing protein n=1 Tax=Monosporascus cannonballus TaxID=155416 RepID=A0ABY0GRP0_9PEZI|nr:hypothetical protein DL762_010032 [Monosporascus cannonballus]RYO76783.1 hypothetical protein DL763_010170 [Monosporascus cannonballus]RYP29561.1 hypothetical protein DL766_005294 [Monosporascus sp. MC13-8B]
MSEYWKSTPKYWCKHCGTYVRDTKLERTNHEATAKHQSALKRFLRDLHRGHEQEQREKERARREIERLNGTVGGGGSGSGSASAGPASKPTAAAGGSTTQAVTKEERQRQWEQLAEMGIDVPTELRPEMAMAGEWTVTNTRVINDDDGAPKTEGSDAEQGTATGVRKRPKREGEDDDDEIKREEDAIRGLFKKPRRWGRDTRNAPEDDAELDALLSGTLVAPKKEEKDADSAERKIKADPDPVPVKKEEQTEEIPKIKKEESTESPGLANITTTGDATLIVKKEEGAGPEVPVVAFKKRKPKNIRQK